MKDYKWTLTQNDIKNKYSTPTHKYKKHTRENVKMPLLDTTQTFLQIKKKYLIIPVFIENKDNYRLN